MAPKSAEAMYQAAYRQGVLVTMYMVDDDKKNADKAAQNCQAIADQMKQKYSEVRLCGAGGEHRVPREAGDSDLWDRP